MSSLPVVNYGRMERLKPAESTQVPLTLNTLCIVFIIIGLLALYKRSVTISQQRGQSYT
jgi:hypothetical protein